MIHMHVIVVSVALPLLTSWHYDLVSFCCNGTQTEVICAWIWFLFQCLPKSRIMRNNIDDPCNTTSGLS